MVLKNNKNIYHPPLWQKWLDKARAHIYRSPLYLVTLRKRQKIDVQNLPAQLSEGNQQRGIGILSGQFSFAGRIYKSDAEPWTVAQDDGAWQAWIHGFKWLDDLCLVEDPQAIVKARHLINSWISLHGVWTPLAWRADVISDRLIHWMINAQKITQSADDDFKHAFFKSLSMQASHLSRSYFKELKGLRLLKALKGQLYLALFVDGFEKGVQRTLERFSIEFDQQILADGGHISRSPSELVEVLGLCLELKTILYKHQIEVPESVLRAIDRMAPMVRTLRHADGGLALFHGAQKGDVDHIDDLLEQTGNLGKPLSDARHSGYQRIEAGRTVVLMDVGTPPDITLNAYGHAAPLSLEVSCAEDRILVNCGSVLGGDPNWQEALAATAAHNTLTVDDKNCLQLLHGGGIAPRPINVSYKRFEENGQVLIDASHDAYKESMGLIHQRSVYVNKSGNDLRFEDRLTGSGGSSYAISLHLHPDVHASLVQDGQAALLKLDNGSGWHLRVQGGRLEMRESIYVSNASDIRHTDQIVIQGPLRGDGVEVKWRLSKIG